MSLWFRQMLDGSPSECEYYATSTPKTIKKNEEFIAFMENQTVSLTTLTDKLQHVLLGHLRL